MPPKRKATATAAAPAPKRQAASAKPAAKKPTARRTAPASDDESEDELNALPLPKARGPPKTKQVHVCHICKSRKNKDGLQEELLSCSTCPNLAHSSCMELPSEARRIALTYDWQCHNCKECDRCREADRADEMLFCDCCDRAWHMDCLRPPLRKAPKGDWWCPLCTEDKRGPTRGPAQTAHETAVISVSSSSDDDIRAPVSNQAEPAPGTSKRTAANPATCVKDTSHARQALLSPDLDDSAVEQPKPVATGSRKKPAAVGKATAKRPTLNQRTTHQATTLEESLVDEDRDEVDFLSSPSPSDVKRVKKQSTGTEGPAARAPISRTIPRDRATKGRTLSKQVFVDLPALPRTRAPRGTRSQNVEAKSRLMLPTPRDTRSPPTPPATTISSKRIEKLSAPASDSEESAFEDTRPAPAAPTRAPGALAQALPEHLHQCLAEQKHAVLCALQKMPVIDQEEGVEDESPNVRTKNDLVNLLNGTVQHGEGNSCLLIGPRGSGKTAIVNEVLGSISKPAVIVRLSGHVQHNDRAALREIARQVAKQIDTAFGAELDAEEVQAEDELVEAPSHLPTLISSLPSLGRPTIVVIDAFELFAEHGRQALLYCLLDTAQSCRASSSTRGLAVVGVTTRVDTLNILEKRVKSRFSGRMLRTAVPRDWAALARSTLLCSITVPTEEWTDLWATAVKRFLADNSVKEALAETFGLVRDARLFGQILTAPILALSPNKPWPAAAALLKGVESQRLLPAFSLLSSVSYPALCLLIAADHERIAGNDAVTFEMLHDVCRRQLQASQAAQAVVSKGGVGMIACSRAVFFAAFESLVGWRTFVPVSGSTNAARQFARYKCMVQRDQIKRAVEVNGQTNLRKWFSKPS